MGTHFMKSVKYLLVAALMGVLALVGTGAAQASDRCTSNFPGSGSIVHKCGLSWIEYDGRQHYFVVGYYDSAVWHTWETARDNNYYASWTSLGGVAQSKVYLKTFDSGRALRAQVWGTDSRFWCRSYNDPSSRGTWTGWYTC